MEEKLMKLSCTKKVFGNSRIFSGFLLFCTTLLIFAYGNHAFITFSLIVRLIRKNFADNKADGFNAFLSALLTNYLVNAQLESFLEPALVDTGTDHDWNMVFALYYAVDTIACIGFGDIYLYFPGTPDLGWWLTKLIISSAKLKFCISVL